MTTTRYRWHWTAERRNYLREMWPKHGSTYISRMLGCGYSSVRQEAARMMLGKPRPGTVEWSPESVARLRELWPQMSCYFLAQHLGVSPKAVRSKARRLRLPRRLPPVRRHADRRYGETWWSKERKAHLWGLRLQGKTFKQIATEMGVTLGAVSGHVHRLKIKRTPLSNKPATIARREREKRRLAKTVLPTELTVGLPSHAPTTCQFVYGNPLRFCTNKRAVVAGRVSMYCKEHGLTIKPTPRLHHDNVV